MTEDAGGGRLDAPPDRAEDSRDGHRGEPDAGDDGTATVDAGDGEPATGDREPAVAGGEPAYCSYTSYESGEGAPDLPATGEGAEGPEAAVWEALYGVEDPEMPVSVVDLGLVYGVAVDGEPDDGDATVRVDMTLTYTGCPARDMLLDDVRTAVEGVPGVADAEVRLVWSPEWNLEMVTERGKRDLREFGLSV